MIDILLQRCVVQLPEINAHVPWIIFSLRRFLLNGKRIAALSFGFSDQRWPFLDEYRRMEESRLTFFGELVDVFHCVSSFAEQVAYVALQHNNRLCFLARVAPGVHDADELESMG